MGWFHGLKLYLVINECDEILACQITPGNLDERKSVPTLCKRLFGKFIANRGYISQPLFEQLLETFNVQLITRLLKNHVAESTGWQGYALFTRQGLEQMQMDKSIFVQQTESYEHFGDVETYVMDMHPRYAGLKADQNR